MDERVEKAVAAAVEHVTFGEITGTTLMSIESCGDLCRAAIEAYRKAEPAHEQPRAWRRSDLADELSQAYIDTGPAEDWSCVADRALELLAPVAAPEKVSALRAQHAEQVRQRADDAVAEAAVSVGIAAAGSSWARGDEPRDAARSAVEYYRRNCKAGKMELEAPQREPGCAMDERVLQQAAELPAVLPVGARTFNRHFGGRGTVVDWPSTLPGNGYKRAVLWDHGERDDVRIVDIESLGILADEPASGAPDSLEAGTRGARAHWENASPADALRPNDRHAQVLAGDLAGEAHRIDELKESLETSYEHIERLKAAVVSVLGVFFSLRQRNGEPVEFNRGAVTAALAKLGRK